MRHGMKGTFTYKNRMDFNFPLLSLLRVRELTDNKNGVELFIRKELVG